MSEEINNVINPEEKKTSSELFSMNLYDLNKSIISQLKVLTKEQIQEKEEVIKKYYNKVTNSHHMLLCREYNYYTIFECRSKLSSRGFFAEVIDIITELGDIYSIDIADPDGCALEIWIKPKADEQNELYAFYLFPYDTGVVYYG